MSKTRGFTTTEMITAIVFVLLVGAIFYALTSSLQASHRDTRRKTAINAIYYNLVEVVRPSLKGYPRSLEADQLKAMDSALLMDPRGNKMGERDSDYRYEPSECNGGDVCQSFTLRASLEREDDFVKRSP
jgi:type II secretory pathway component PulJ